MLIVNPRASSIAPRQAEVIPFPKEETTPPVIKTYDVMCELNVGRALLIGASEKQERAGLKAPPANYGAFFQPLVFRAVVGLKTVLNVIRASALMQCGATAPLHGYARSADGVSGHPKVTHGHELLPAVQQWQALSHPRNHALFLK